MKKEATYQIELGCNDPEWRRMQVVMIARTLDSNGNPTGYTSVRERFDEADTSSQPPFCTQLQAPDRGELTLYLYIIPHTLPLENDLYEVPAVVATLTITLGSEQLLCEELRVNPWGGYSQILRPGK